MSGLADIIKKKKVGQNRKPIHAVIKRDVAEEFKAICRKHKIDMSAAIEELLVKEIREFKAKAK